MTVFEATETENSYEVEVKRIVLSVRKGSQNYVMEANWEDPDWTVIDVRRDPIEQAPRDELEAVKQDVLAVMNSLMGGIAEKLMENVSQDRTKARTAFQKRFNDRRKTARKIFIETYSHKEKIEFMTQMCALGVIHPSWKKHLEYWKTYFAYPEDGESFAFLLDEYVDRILGCTEDGDKVCEGIHYWKWEETQPKEPNDPPIFSEATAPNDSVAMTDGIITEIKDTE